MWVNNALNLGVIFYLGKNAMAIAINLFRLIELIMAYLLLEFCQQVLPVKQLGVVIP